MNWKIISTNWKTSLMGAISLLAALANFLLSVPSFATAARAWASHQPVDWRGVILSVVVSAIAASGGTGLLSAKDATTHSTPAEVNQAGKEPLK